MSCFGGKDELIYLVELTVERLRLAACKYAEDFVDCLPMVKLKFIDFPVFVITRRRSQDDGPAADDSTTAPLTPQQPPPSPYDESEGLFYNAGKSCLFVRKPRDLVDAMQSQPLRIGIFRGQETFPLAECSIPLSGCLCDQVAMVGNDEFHKPSPYQLSGNYKIVDVGKNPAGSIDFSLRLTFFGSYIISHYQLFDEFCVFKNDFDGEYCITKIKQDESNENGEEQFKLGDRTVLAAMGSATIPKRTN